jgi:caspase domain-containing protein
MSDLTVPTTETATGATYALLIGVDDYANLDDTTDAHDLKGSRNDVLLLARYCLTVLCMPIENIRMLTSPRFKDDELKELVEALQQEVSLDFTKLQKASENANESDVTVGVGWLLENTKVGDTALLSFSGHGSWSNTMGPVLCLGDTKRDDATGEVANGVLALGELQRRIERAGARSRLIAVLDCCHITGPATHPRLQTTGIPHAGTAKDVEADDLDFNVSDRVLLAAQPGQLAHQMRLGMHWHGALTFALVTTAERWLATNGVSHGSYEQVWTRANEVITALDVPQTPMRKVPAATLTEIWQEPFLGVKAGKTVPTPDAVGMSTQLPPDWLFTITVVNADGTNTILAQILTMGRTHLAKFTQGDRTSAPTGGSSEAWFVNHSALTNLVSPSASLLITSQQPGVDDNGVLLVTLDSRTTFDFGHRGVLGVSTYYAPENATWDTRAPDPIDGNSYCFTASSTSNPVMSVQFIVSSQDSTILKAAQWYQAYSSVPSPPPVTIQPGTGSGLAYQFNRSAPTPTSTVYTAASTLTQQ